jgi:ankyrin repeat protein
MKHHPQNSSHVSDDVRLLFQCFPCSLHAATKDEGLLPLHIAAKSSNVGLIQFVVEGAPDLVRCMSKEGWLPLHYAAAIGEDRWVNFEAIRQRQLRLGCVQHLVQQWPESVQIRNRGGLTALLIALANARPLLEVVRFLIDQEPPANRSALQLVGSLPLHVAASHVDTPLAMEPVVERWPESVRQRDGDGSLPIHLAVARREVPLEVVQYLVERDPGSVRLCDRRGFLPLHLAVSYAEPSIELVRLLMDHHPPSVGHADNDGSLPLHLAVSHAEPSSELVRILVDHHPPSVGHADSGGSLPLHLAASHAKPPAAMELVQFLVDRDDGLSLGRPNGAGLLPLHVAAGSVNAPLDVLYYLARSRPESIYCYANGGQQGVVGGGGSTSKGRCKRRRSDSP